MSASGSLTPPSSINTAADGEVSGAEPCFNASASDPSLPPSIGSKDDAAPESFCCKRHCSKQFEAEKVETYKMDLHRGAASEVKARKFDRLKDLFKANNPERQHKGLCWTFEGKEVCRKFWESMHSLSPGKTTEMLKLLKSGQTTLPPPGPRQAKPEPILDKVSLWMLDLYQNLADPLAVPGSEDRLPESLALAECLETSHEIIDDPGHPLFGLSFNLDTGGDVRRVAGRRFLNFVSVNELFKFYTSDVPVSEQSSRSTFDRAWKGWKKYLTLKSPSQGNKCTICLHLAEQRSNAETQEERMQIDAEKNEHLNTIKRDRKVNTRGNQKGSDLGNFKPANRHEGFAKLQMDGMDQAKFCIPRAKRLCGTSEYGKCWKPNVHVVGSIVYGVVGIYFLLPMDNPKDSNMQSTLLSRSLDIARCKLSEMDPDFDLPERLAIGVDNTPRESKNQLFASFCSFLTSRLFTSIEVQYLQAQHTHNELDQRFSSLATIIKAEPEIQTIYQLKDIIEQKMKPIHAKHLVVEVISNTWDFASWLRGQTDASMSGLTSTKLQGANHLWRFERRDVVEPRATIECHHQGWEKMDPNPRDVCLTVKQFLSDPEPSQPPELVMPASVWQQLQKSVLKPATPNSFSPIMLAEFRKTAELVGRGPWHLLEGQVWLEELCASNEQGLTPAAVNLEFVFSLEGTEPRIEPLEAPTLENIVLLDPPPPRRVQVNQRPQKRPAAAAPKLIVRRLKSRPAAAIPDDPQPAGGDEYAQAEIPDAGPHSPTEVDHERELEPAPGPPVLCRPGARQLPMKRPAAALHVEPEPESEEAIKALPNFLYFGCGKCRPKPTPKIGCKECREKASRNHAGFRKTACGWVYRLQIEDVD